MIEGGIRKVGREHHWIHHSVLGVDWHERMM